MQGEAWSWRRVGTGFALLAESCDPPINPGLLAPAPPMGQRSINPRDLIQARRTGSHIVVNEPAAYVVVRVPINYLSPLPSLSASEGAESWRDGWREGKKTPMGNNKGTRSPPPCNPLLLVVLGLVARPFGARAKADFATPLYATRGASATLVSLGSPRGDPARPTCMPSPPGPGWREPALPFLGTAPSMSRPQPSPLT